MEEKWYNKTVEETEEYLQTNIREGLSSLEVKKDKRKMGTTNLRPKRRNHYL